MGHRHFVGDIVHLASDRDAAWPMTVVRRENEGAVEVVWLDGDGAMSHKYLPDDALVPAAPNQALGFTVDSTAPLRQKEKE